MARDRITFKYLRKPTPNDKMKSRDSFRYMEYALIMLGWLPPPKTSMYSYFGLYKVARSILFVLSAWIPFAFVITYYKELSTFSPGELLTSVQAFINTPCAFLKSVITFMNIWRLSLLKDSLRKLDDRLIKDDEQNIVHRNVRRCNYIYLFCTSIYYMFAILTLLASANRGQVPWRVYNPFVDWRDGYFSLWVSLVYELLFASVALSFNIVNDMLPLIFGLNIHVHMELLRKRILRLRTDPRRSEDLNYDDLKACIMDHKIIEGACSNMRPYLSPIYFIQFLAVGMLLGITMCNIMFFADLELAIGAAIYVFAVTIQTFPFCYMCNLISSDCDELAISLFHSNWFDARPQYKSSLIYFMHSVQQNITFTAGSIFQICLTTNFQVAKFAFSVVTFIQQMNLAENLKSN